MKGLKRSAVALFGLVCSIPGYGALITMDMGEVELLGDLYAFTFAYDSEASDTQQSFEALGGEITFDNQADALSVAETLLDVFPSFDWNPANDSPITDGLRIAFDVDGGAYSYVTIREWSTDEIFGPFTQQTDQANNFSLAFFERIDSAVDVPEPGTLGLIFYGAIFFIGLSGRKYREG